MTTDVTDQIMIIIDQATADALCCYLDEEDVFPDVVSKLLKALPLPVSPEPEMWYHPKSFDDVLNLFHRPSIGVFAYNDTTLREFLDRNPHIGYDKDTVFQINQFPYEEGSPWCKATASTSTGIGGGSTTTRTRPVRPWWATTIRSRALSIARTAT